MWSEAGLGDWRIGADGTTPYGHLYYANWDYNNWMISDCSSDYTSAAEISIVNDTSRYAGGGWPTAWYAGGLVTKFYDSNNYISAKVRQDGQFEVIEFIGGSTNIKWQEVGAANPTGLNTIKLKVIGGRQVYAYLNEVLKVVFTSAVMSLPTYFGIEGNRCRSYFGPFYCYQDNPDLKYLDWFPFWAEDYNAGTFESKINQVAIPGAYADHVQFGGRKNRTLTFQCKVTTNAHGPITTESAYPNTSIENSLFRLSLGKHVLIRTPYITTSGYIQNYTPLKPVFESGRKIWNFSFNLIERAYYE
jgi:hypothetical protein